MRRAAIITFHNTPNYGATLQCFALHNYLKDAGCVVEVINYMPPQALKQYAKSLFGGKRRSIYNVMRVWRFYGFVRRNIKLSGAPIFFKNGLPSLKSKEYDIAFSGSDEVWKVDHMRSFDSSFYLDFLDDKRTRLVAYAATSSTVTDLRKFGSKVSPLLKRFAALGIRDSSTANMVADILGKPPTQVLDPTLIWDFSKMNLPPMREKPYLAVYCWISDEHMREVKTFAHKNGLEVVCVGCRHKLADVNLIGIGPEEWLRLIKHASAVITDFFHGVLFSIIFHRPFYAHVDEMKRMKLLQALQWVGLVDHLHESPSGFADVTLAQLDADWSAVDEKLNNLKAHSRAFIQSQLNAIGVN